MTQDTAASVTTTFVAILSPLVAILGVVTGVLLNEFVRRRNRRELYAPKIFEKRLAAYEKLADLIENGSEIAQEVIDNAEFTREQRHALISEAILTIARHTDSHKLYIDEELAVHCTALFMGVEDIYDEKGEKRETLLKNFYDARYEAFRMIAEDSGISEINKLFKIINRPKLSGPIIELTRELRQKK